MHLLVFILLLSWVQDFSQHVQASNFDCQNDRNYSSGSPYQQNLYLTFNSLASSAALDDYSTSSIGSGPDQVYGLVQCTAYTSRDACQACATNMASQITQLCPNQKQGSIYNEKCTLQYSDRNFFSHLDSTVRYFSVWDRVNATDIVLLGTRLEALLQSLWPYAAGSRFRVASGNSAYTKAQKIYALVQCSKGISGSDCLTCLQNVSMKCLLLLDKGQSGLLFAPSCNLRYDSYLFYSALPPFQSGLDHPPPPSLLEEENQATSHVEPFKIIVMLVIAAALALMMMTGTYSFLFWRNRRRNGVVGDSNRSLESLLIEFDKLREATNNFADQNKLGQGGFGLVYKGKMVDGQEIAVKRLSTSSKQGLEELQTEVMLVAKLLHQNLVKLLGFCIEEEEKLLVYEYLPNGSLDKFLFDQKRRLKLNWEMRYNIIIGIARGLLYLHEECPLKIIHRDMKASNILLDESMTPKISDFGLARLFPGTQNHCTTTRIIGTYGYMAPEYAVRGRYSTKSDVYSFGILVLEIITGAKNSSFQDSRNLQSYAWQHWVSGTALKIVDSTLGEEFKKDEVLKCINVGLLCVQEAAEKRPTMSDIILKLGSYTKRSASPLLTGFSIARHIVAPDLLKEGSDVTAISIRDYTNRPFSN